MSLAGSLWLCSDQHCLSSRPPPFLLSTSLSSLGALPRPKCTEQVTQRFNLVSIKPPCCADKCIVIFWNWRPANQGTSFRGQPSCYRVDGRWRGVFCAGQCNPSRFGSPQTSPKECGGRAAQGGSAGCARCAGPATPLHCCAALAGLGCQRMERAQQAA